MPTYDYQCESCRNVREVFHSISEEPEILCEQCKARMKRMIGSGAGIIFKGSGFYVNDYKGCSCKNESAPAKSESACSCSGACSHSS